MQHPLYLLQCTPPFSTFIKSFISFDSFLHKMFGHLFSLGSFDSPERPLVCKQASLPITFGGIRFISTSTIAPTTYLESWALVGLVIAVRFMVDHCPFLLKALTWVDNNTFPFQQHLKATCDFLPPPARVCFLPFEQLIGQQMLNIKIPSWSVCTIMPFFTCFSMGHLKPIVLKFYHVLAQL